MAAGYRRRSDDGWYPAAGPPLNWWELSVLFGGWGKDDRHHLHRSVYVDWEFQKLTNVFGAHSLLALQGANWQRAGGKGDRPKLFTPALFRGDEDDSIVNDSGVRSGRRRGRVAAISSAGDLAGVKERMRARRQSRQR